MDTNPVVTQQSLVVRRTAHVYTLTHSSASRPTRLWIVLHGYGEAADSFVRQFEVTSDPTLVFCAPEGLSKFYPKGTGGETGASWLTSRNRDSEIADYLQYLDDVAALMQQQFPSITSIGVLGFSQGSSTASRWVAKTSAPVSRLILWGGTVANDADIQSISRALGETPVDIVVGSRDKFINEDRIAQERNRFASANLSVTETRFEGGHRLDDATLVALLKP